MRDLDSIEIRLTDALAAFPDFDVVRGESLVTHENYIVVVSRAINDFQEIAITSDNVTLGRYFNDIDTFHASGDWFAVTSIVFAVLSGRE